jgi:type II secretory pathway component PulC
MLKSPHHDKKAIFLVVNLTLGVLVAWLVWGGAQNTRVSQIAMSPSVSKATNKESVDFSMRKTSPALEEILTKSTAFSSEFDARSQPITRAPTKAPKFKVQVVSAAKSHYNWEALRVAGVVSIEGERHYAVIEDKRTGEQALISEGEEFKDGVVLTKIENNRIILKTAGETKEIEILLEPPADNRSRRLPRAVARSWGG